MQPCTGSITGDRHARLVQDHSHRHRDDRAREERRGHIVGFWGGGSLATIKRFRKAPARLQPVREGIIRAVKQGSQPSQSGKGGRVLREDNIFYAKRNLVDSIWKEARIEGIGITFPQTQEIVEGRSVAGLSIDDVMVVNNLKHAWQYVFETLDEPLTLEWVRGLNLKIGEGGIVRYAGDLRTGTVTMGGTSWIPPMPDVRKLAEVIESLAQIEDATDRALSALALISRAQMFNDGNKRTAQLAANKILIESGAGILAIPEEHKMGFLERLVSFYETDDPAELKSFLRDTCLDCPNLSPES